MKREEIFNDIVDTWNKYKEIDHPNYTSDEFRQADDLLDDIGRLIETK